MRYLSTRGAQPSLAFDEVLLTGLARDGGLFLPESWPQLDLAALAGLDYPTLAARVMQPFLGGRIGEADFARLVQESYAGFGHKAVAPLKQIDSRLWLMELFHGPTLAFKDVALQLLGRLYDHVLAKRGQRITIVGATSGDTGSAAIEACRDRPAIDIFILHPEGRTSEVQRRQMTTVDVAQCAQHRHPRLLRRLPGPGEGPVRRCLFPRRDASGRRSIRSTGAASWPRSSITWRPPLRWARPKRRIAFAVPTGNFGNVYAGYAARAMGLPVEKFIVGSNSNDILTRFIQSGVMKMGAVHPTLSPSMDIQVSSNAERLLFDLYDRDPARLVRAMQQFRQSGEITPRSWPA